MWSFILMAVMATLSLFLFLVCMCEQVSAIPRDRLYPFGPATGDTELASNDDLSSPRIDLQGGFFPYFGEDRTFLFVSRLYMYSRLCSVCQ